MASTSTSSKWGKRKEIYNLIHGLDIEYGTISATDADYCSVKVMMTKKISILQTLAELDDAGEGQDDEGGLDSDNGDDVRIENRNIYLRRKNNLKNLEEVMDKSNYDRLPPQEPQTFTWAQKKGNGRSYEGRHGQEQVIRNAPRPSRRALTNSEMHLLCKICWKVLNNLQTVK